MTFRVLLKVVRDLRISQQVRENQAGLSNLSLLFGNCALPRLIAAPATAATAATTAAAISATAAAAATTTTAISATTATTATTSARSLFFCLIDRQRPTTNISPIQCLDSGLGVARTLHFNEGKAPGSSGITICNDLDIGDLTITLFKEGAERRCIRIKREITNIHSCSHAFETPSVGLRPTSHG